MGVCELQRIGGFSSAKDAKLLVDDIAGQDHGGTMDDGCGCMSFSDDSIVSNSTLDFSDDDETFSSSSTSSSSSSSLALHSSPEVASNGPLYELSQLMAHLPIKRGLSRHYLGKSQSFTSLSNVSCVEDLVKKSAPDSKKMKSCKSYGGFLDTPGACTRTISKKASTNNSYLLSKKKSRFIQCIKPPISVKKIM